MAPLAPCLPFAPKAQAGASIHPGRDAHLHLLFFVDDPGTLAGGAGSRNNDAGPLAIRTVVEDFQNSRGLGSPGPGPGSGNRSRGGLPGSAPSPPAMGTWHAAFPPFTLVSSPRAASSRVSTTGCRRSAPGWG